MKAVLKGIAVVVLTLAGLIALHFVALIAGAL